MAEQQFVTFYVGEDLYGIDILAIREIYTNPMLTRVDAAPPYMKGLLNLRGQIVAVVDLRVKLNVHGENTNPPQQNVEENKKQVETKQRDTGLKSRIVLVLKSIHRAEQNSKQMSSDTVGLMADRIGDVLAIESQHITPPPAHMDKELAVFVSGVATLEDKLLVVLNTETLTQFEQQK